MPSLPSGAMTRFDSILDTVGRTPVVRLNALAPPGVNVFVKIEAFNPLGSIKDRMALGVIEDAERRGVLAPGQTVVEGTSGNTGIGLAMVCAAKGYPLVIVMPENASVERRRILRFLGAKVVLTPAPLRGTGMLDKALELADAHGWFLCRQFENEANADIHARTTAREILAAFADTRLDAWVSGFGTGGTVKGVARVLRQESPDTRIVVCEPRNSRTLASGIRQARDAGGRPTGSHPEFRTHPVQGWAPDFVPKLAEDAALDGLIDEMVGVDSGEGMRLARELASREGIFAGLSSGATLAGALAVARRLPAGANVLCMLPDTGERYLSTPLFDGVDLEMNDDELAISRSTPTARFDAPAPAPAAKIPALDEVDAGALAFVDRTVADPANPAAMFALEWCEFCWSVRKLFRALGVPLHSIDLDSAELLDGDRGMQIKAALAARTGAGTVPQLFVGGELVGGCTETLAAATDGSLQRRLAAAGVAIDPERRVDGASFLPSWLHARG